MNCHPANQCNTCKAEDEYMMTNNIPNDLTGVIVPHDYDQPVSRDGMNPIHDHDCENCHYIGTAVFSLRMYDFYYCPTEIMGGHLICRWGSKLGEYSSAPYAIAEELAGTGIELAPVYKYALAQYRKYWDTIRQEEGYHAACY